MGMIRENKSLDEERFKGHRKALRRAYRKAGTRVLYRSEGAKPHYCLRCGSHCILTLDVNGMPTHLCPRCDY